MSDQPDSTPNTLAASPAALRDTRWLAGVIWGGLLLALIVTSWAAVTGGGVGATFSLFPFINLGNQNPEDTNPDLVATIALVLSVIVATLVVLAWTRFASTTMSLVSSLSDSSDDPVTSRPRSTGCQPCRANAANWWTCLGSSGSPGA